MKSRTFVADALGPVRAYLGLRRAGGEGASFLLESVVGGERWGRYSIVGYRPRYETLLESQGWTVRGDAPQSQRPGTLGDPLRAAAALFAATDPRVKDDLASVLHRAQVGYLAWDLVHEIEPIARWEGGGQAPLAHFVGGSTIVVFDNLRQTMSIVAESDDEVDRTYEALRQSIDPRPIPVPDRSKMPSGVEVSLSDADYMDKVRRAQEYIRAGDAFQVVLARSFSIRVPNVDPFDVYRALRVLNPSPYMYYLDFPPGPGETSRTQVAGASPETMVRLDHGQMTVRPLAGTRPRGATDAEDLANEVELLADPKERAEHVMLIDLGRNDVGRVAQVGSVELLRRMEIERYSHVMHIVSEVVGKIPEGTSPLEVLRAAFPAGTLSGAPKIRAMQIIRELETRPRGIYGGAVGYVAKTGDLDFAIAIRTALFRDGVMQVTAGAGIVEASDPRLEAEETRNKARGVLCALEAIR